MSERLTDILESHAKQLSVRIAVNRSQDECKQILAQAILNLTDDRKILRHVYEDLNQALKSDTDKCANSFFEAAEQFHAMWAEMRKWAPAERIQELRVVFT